MRNKRLWTWLGAIFLALAAFWLLDFRLAASSNKTEKLVMTTDMGENLPASMRQRDPISLVMVGDGPMVGALQEALQEQLQEAGLGAVQLEQELEAQYPNPVLVVKVLKPGPLWTPVFAMGSFSVHAGYDSGGDTTFMQPIEDTHTSVGKPDAANYYGEYDVQDRSLGLISRPGYHRYLADALAQEIVSALEGLYKV